jgi:hypothetical protein
MNLQHVALLSSFYSGQVEMSSAAGRGIAGNSQRKKQLWSDGPTCFPGPFFLSWAGQWDLGVSGCLKSYSQVLSSLAGVWEPACQCLWSHNGD